MSDARNKLTEALANAKVKRASSAAKSSSQSATTSRRASSPTSTSAAKSSPPKNKAPKPKKKQAPKPKKSGPGAGSELFKSFQSFANNMIDELKSATSEITPTALLNTANDSFKSIKQAVGLGHENASDTDDRDLDVSEEEKETFPDQADAPSPTQQHASTSLSSNPSPPSNSQVPTANVAASPQQMTSPAKVQRIPSKKKKVADDIAVPDQNVVPGVSMPVQESPENFNAQASAPPETQTSPAKVQRAPSSKSPADASIGAANINIGEPSADVPPETTSPAKVQRVASKTKTTEEDAEADAAAPAGQTVEESVPAELQEQPAEEIAVEKPAATQKAAPLQAPTAISKTEQAVRSFHALQTLLTNPIWSGIINDPQTKPSTLYAPRQNFDTNFSNPIFREGLKSASRLASAYGFEPEKMRFNPKAMERVKAVEIDPGEKIKPHTQNISSAIGEEKVKEILGIYNDKNFKHLLLSVSTRVGSFVPTIESLARIYLGLRKKEQLNSGQRLQIQEEILMRYRKAPYSEEMGKKARNLALNYFMDYLVNYACKLYKDRFKDAPDGQNTLESFQRRHATIKAFCCDSIEEWAKKIALSTQAIMSMQGKFTDQANHHFETVLHNLPGNNNA